MQNLLYGILGKNNKSFNWKLNPSTIFHSPMPCCYTFIHKTPSENDNLTIKSKKPLSNHYFLKI